MRMSPARILHNAMILCFFLVIAAGCAHDTGTFKEGNAGDMNVAVVQAIRLSSDGSAVEIVADKPLTYTFYKIDYPPKTVIDLAQTEPGLVATPIDVNKGNIKHIEVTKHSFGGGFLSRVEIFLTKDEEFLVTPDPANKGKLLVTFSQPQPQEQQIKADVKGDANENQAKGGEQQPVSPAGALNQKVQPPTAEPKAEEQLGKASEIQPSPGAAFGEKSEVKLAAAKEGEKPSGIAQMQASSQPKLFTAVTAVNDGVEIKVTGGVDRYNSFKMSKPDRLVIDMFGVRSSITKDAVAINRFGIGNARIGLSRDKVRIVFDAAKGKLRSHQIEKNENGLKVIFSEAAASPERSGGTAAGEQGKTKADLKKGILKGSVEGINFKLVEGYSRISIKLSGDCVVGEPARSAKGLTLTIDNCQIPRKWQRMLDTSAFASVVQDITPYQVKGKGGYSTKILVKLRADAPFTIKQDGDTFNWDIKNPDFMDTPVPVSETPKVHSVPVVITAPEEKGVTSTKKYTGRKVSLEFSDADIRKIFQLIAEVSNHNFLIADDVTGTISLKLVNVPWDQALDVILESKNLEMKREGNIVQIKPKGKFKTIEQEEAEAKKARERAMELHTEIFDINYASLSDVVTQLKSLATSREGVSITPDNRTNRVIVTDIALAIEKMRNLLKSLDVPEKQVMIEARIVEATSTFTRDIGVQWGIHYADGTASFLGISRVDTGFGGVVTPPPLVGTSGPGGALGMTFGKLASNLQIDLRLSAAATNGLIKIISTPKVVTLNNKAAKITQGQSIPYQTTSAEGTKTEFVEAALTLEVTPHITADGSIGMKIKASNNSAGTGSPPPINKKEATTEMQVKNGETTVIGGVYMDSDTEQDQGVPFLQDIPLLGWLFKSNSKTKTKTELLIFITPRIVS